MVTLDNPQRCRKCGGRGRVVDTRDQGGHRRRRYGCEDCDERWNTFETLIDPKRIIKIPARDRDSRPR